MNTTPNTMKKLFFFTFLTITLLSCSNNSEDDLTVSPSPTPTIVTYTNTVKSIIDTNCISCHGNSNPNAGLSLTTYAQVKSGVINNNLLGRINSSTNPMPNTGKLPQTIIDKVFEWNTAGLLE